MKTFTLGDLQPSLMRDILESKEWPVQYPLTTRTPDDPTDAHLVNDPEAV